MCESAEISGYAVILHLLCCVRIGRGLARAPHLPRTHEPTSSVQKQNDGETGRARALVSPRSSSVARCAGGVNDRGQQKLAGKLSGVPALVHTWWHTFSLDSPLATLDKN